MTLLRGNCLDLMREMAENSVDSIVTDPPYGLGFMGKEWDRPKMLGQLATGDEIRGAFAYGGTHSRGYADHDPLRFQAWFTEIAAECLRVLKPGGHLLAFGGSRTYHRLACAVEDAGFEIRDQIMWLYGSGFPKSLNLDGDRKGWGTALKPAHEPIVVARKPLVGTVANNVLAYGTGALNIDGCRVVGPRGDGVWGTSNESVDHGGRMFNGSANPDYRSEAVEVDGQVGRWPANVIHDGSDEVLAGFPDTAGGSFPTQRGAGVATGFGVGRPTDGGARQMGDNGSAARFFYCAKASKAERNGGLEGLPEREAGIKNEAGRGFSETDPHAKIMRANFHPTVKPVDLMRYLVRLVTPPGGVVLDPFLGSGTTAVAAILEGFGWLGCEMTEDYWPIIEGRVAWAMRQEIQTTLLEDGQGNWFA